MGHYNNIWLAVGYICKEKRYLKIKFSLDIYKMKKYYYPYYIYYFHVYLFNMKEKYNL